MEHTEPQEWLHATDRYGRHVKSGARHELIAKMQHDSQLHGDAPFALPVVHIWLLTSDDRLRIVKRGNKTENPYLWDKAAAGHVVNHDPQLPRKAFDESACRELAEELGLVNVAIAEHALEAHHWLNNASIDLHTKAILWMIDHDPWLGGLSRNRAGGLWLKRQNVVTYVGVYDGPFTFIDQEAIAERTLAREQLRSEWEANPFAFADGVRLFLQRYYYVVRLY